MGAQLPLCLDFLVKNIFFDLVIKFIRSSG